MEQAPAPPPDTSLFQLNVEAGNSYTLKNAAAWAKLTGVVGMILGALFGWITIVALSNSGTNEYGYRRRNGFDEMLQGSGTSNTLGIIILFFTCAIFILGGIFSWSFGNKINLALRASDQVKLNSAFAGLRNYYAVRAITLILVLLLFLISFAAALGRF